MLDVLTGHEDARELGVLRVNFEVPLRLRGISRLGRAVFSFIIRSWKPTHHISWFQSLKATHAFTHIIHRNRSRRMMNG